jgi:threonylcarbamoyladenosine tRNA methylthiotransferase MtaB
VFTYSERPGTFAVDELDSMGGAPVPKHVRSERNRRLRLLSEKKKGAFYNRYLGMRRPVLWESAQAGGMMSGFTDNHIRVEKEFNEAECGQIESVELGRMNSKGIMSHTEMRSLPIL